MPAVVAQVLLFDLGDARTIRAADIMTPRIVMFTLDETMTVAEAMAAHAEIPFSRIPLYGRSPDDIDSVLLKADLYLAGARDRHDAPLSELAMPLTAVTEAMPITESVPPEALSPIQNSMMWFCVCQVGPYL